MQKHTDSLMLRRALLGNAAFSILSGLTFLIAAGPLAPVLGVPAFSLRIVGGVLMPFAFGLVVNARRPSLNRKEALLAIYLDLAWVVGSLLLVFARLWPLETAGIWTVLGVAEVVLFFALLQAWGLRRSSAADSSTAANAIEA